MLTAAVAAGIKYINSAYEVSEIHKYLDFINLMAYGMLKYVLEFLNHYLNSFNVMLNLLIKIYTVLGKILRAKMLLYTNMHLTKMRL
jgi:hypothetical protein